MLGPYEMRFVRQTKVRILSRGRNYSLTRGLFESNNQIVGKFLDVAMVQGNYDFSQRELQFVQCKLDIAWTTSFVKPGLHIVGRIVSMCLRPRPKEHITAL